jgi:pantoate kinase
MNERIDRAKELAERLLAEFVPEPDLLDENARAEMIARATGIIAAAFQVSEREGFAVAVEHLRSLEQRIWSP